MNNFEKILKKTEQRFFDRNKERNEKAKLIREGKIFEATPSELVECRLFRLNADSSTARAMISEGLKFISTEPSVPPPQNFPIALERILGTNDLISIGFLEKGLSISHGCGARPDQDHPRRRGRLRDRFPGFVPIAADQ